MSYSNDLLATAEKMLRDVDGFKASGSDCARAVSTAYYAVFYYITGRIADRLGGVAARGSDQWVKIQRSVQHKPLLEALGLSAKERGQIPYSQTQIAVAVFNRLQKAREDADYDASRSFDVAESLQLLGDARARCDWAFQVDDLSTPFGASAADDLTYLIRCLFLPKSFFGKS